MFVKAGAEIQIYCDYTSRTLRVGTDSFPIPGFREPWREIGVFTSYAEWAASPLSKQVSEESVQEAIVWFWADMEQETIDEKDLTHREQGPFIILFLSENRFTPSPPLSALQVLVTAGVML